MEKRYGLETEATGLSTEDIKKTGRFAFAQGDGFVAAFCPSTGLIKKGPAEGTAEEAMIVMGCASCPFSESCFGATNDQLAELLEPIIMDLMLRMFLEGGPEGEVC